MSSWEEEPSFSEGPRDDGSGLSGSSMVSVHVCVYRNVCINDNIFNSTCIKIMINKCRILDVGLQQ